MNSNFFFYEDRWGNILDEQGDEAMDFEENQVQGYSHKRFASSTSADRWIQL